MMPRITASFMEEDPGRNDSGESKARTVAVRFPNGEPLLLAHQSAFLFDHKDLCEDGPGGGESELIKYSAGPDGVSLGDAKTVALRPFERVRQLMVVEAGRPPEKALEIAGRSFRTSQSDVWNDDLLLVLKNPGRFGDAGTEWHFRVSTNYTEGSSCLLVVGNSDDPPETKRPVAGDLLIDRMGRLVAMMLDETRGYVFPDEAPHRANLQLVLPLADSGLTEDPALLMSLGERE